MIEVEEGARPFPPYRDDGEKRILEEVKGSGGDIFRVDLRQRIGGSNTTFVRKIASLKERGLIEEYKRRAGEGDRLRTAYRLTDYANQLFNVERALGTEKWFSASQKIELFPEFERMARALGETAAAFTRRWASSRATCSWRPCWLRTGAHPWRRRT